MTLSMDFNRLPALKSFLSNAIADADPDADQQTVTHYVTAATGDAKDSLIAQLKTFLDAGLDLAIEDLGTISNRWFSEPSEAHAWLTQVLSLLESSHSSATGGALTVKDSNGTPLLEGDTVMVIKDLKVKGGSSDLKRGTVVKKIHLIDDAEAIECRVNGSTLVLKTCFLKKA